MGVRDVEGKVNRVEKSGKSLRNMGYDPFFGGVQVSGRGTQFYNLSLNVRKALLLSHLKICSNVYQARR